MLDKLQAIEDRYLDLEAKISDPDVIADQSNWQKATKAHAKLEPPFVKGGGPHSGGGIPQSAALTAPFRKGSHNMKQGEPYARQTASNRR